MVLCAAVLLLLNMHYAPAESQLVVQGYEISQSLALTEVAGSSVCPLDGAFFFPGLRRKKISTPSQLQIGIGLPLAAVLVMLTRGTHFLVHRISGVPAWFLQGPPLDIRLAFVSSCCQRASVWAYLQCDAFFFCE